MPENIKIPDINTLAWHYRNQALKALQNGEYEKCKEILDDFEEIVAMCLEMFEDKK